MANELSDERYEQLRQMIVQVARDVSQKCIDHNYAIWLVNKFPKIEAPARPVAAEPEWVEKMRAYLQQRINLQRGTRQATEIIDLRKAKKLLALLPAPREDHVVDASKKVESSDTCPVCNERTCNCPQWLHDARCREENWSFDPDLRDVTLPTDEQLRKKGVKVVGFDKPTESKRWWNRDAVRIKSGLIFFGYNHIANGKRLIVADADAAPTSDDTAARVERLAAMGIGFDFHASGQYKIVRDDGTWSWWSGKGWGPMAYVKYYNFLDAVTAAEQAAKEADDE